MAKKSFKIGGNLANALDDTVSSAKNNAGELHIEIIPLRKIALDPDNPRDLALNVSDLTTNLSKKDADFQRKSAEKEALKSLTKSIREQGVINPILVYKDGDQYRLIAGERRTFSSILAEKTDIPAKILTQKPDPLKLSLLQWVENIERTDLSLWERMRNIEKILIAYAETEKKTPSEITPTSLSQLLGCSLQQGVNYRHVLNASDALQAQIKSGDIKNIEKAAFIAKSHKQLQASLLQACLNGATLAALKKMSPSIIKKPTKTKAKPKINLGHTQHTEVVKVMIHTIIEHKKFQHLRNQFKHICWEDHQSTTTAFHQLVKLLEKA